MFVRDLNQRMAEESEPEAKHREAKDQVDYYHKGRESWLQFCLFPDIHNPRRMPSMFPVPTHIVRRQKVFQLSLSGAQSGNTIYGMWQPESLDMPLTGNVSASTAEGLRSCFRYTNDVTTVDYSNNLDSNSSVAFSTVATPPLVGSASIPVSTLLFSPTNVAHSGVRLIGAYIEFEYVGTSEQHSGMIEVGLHLHTSNNLQDLAVPHFMDQTEIVQAPLYRKFRPIDGCRLVWFPIDNSDFEFSNYATDPFSNRVLLDTGVTIIDTNFATCTSAAYSNAMGPFKKSNFAQWGINISGLQTGQAIRVHMCSYYETCPDENYRDIFMPARTSEYSDPSASKSAVTALANQGAFATPAKTSGNFANIMSLVNNAADIAMKTYGVVAPVVSGFASTGWAGGLSSALGLGAGAALGKIKGMMQTE